MKMNVEVKAYHVNLLQFLETMRTKDFSGVPSDLPLL